jgi:hypothetical protein
VEFYHLIEANKFAAASVAIFESAFPKKNHFIFISGSREQVLSLSENIDYSLLKDWNWKDAPNKLRGKRIVAHSLNHRICRLLNGLDIAELIWLVYGAEVYNNPLLVGIDSWKTHKWTDNLNLSFRYYWYLFKVQAARVRGIIHGDVLQKSMLQKADRVGILFEEEFNHFKKLKVLGPQSSFLPYTFYPLVEVIKEPQTVPKAKTKILIGNSANLTSLTIPVIPLLSKYTSLGWRFLFPLSYGDDDYKILVEKEAIKGLGVEALFLKDFMPLAEYEEVLEEVGIAIFNARRQQGVGNILSLIMKGARLYINSNSTIYTFLKRLGIHFNDVHDLSRSKHKLELLSNEQQRENREILQELIKYSIVVDKLKSSLQIKI